MVLNFALLHLLVFAVFIHSSNSSALDIQPRIISGKAAKQGQFPWHVVLKNVFMSNVKQVSCGGSLISPIWVITAAHCIFFWPWIYLEFGTENLYKPAVQNIVSQLIYFHSSFDANIPVHDIGLVKLPRPVILNEYVQPISLPTQDWLRTPLVGHIAIVIGFGKTADNDLSSDEESATELNFANLQIISNDECSKYFANELTDEVLCCKGVEKNEGACTFDSGGSLIARSANGRYMLIGIVSYRPDVSCEIAGLPTVFTKVTSYLGWIKEITSIKIK